MFKLTNNKEPLYIQPPQPPQPHYNTKNIYYGIFIITLLVLSFGLLCLVLLFYIFT
jgi:hypothetical protein